MDNKTEEGLKRMVQDYEYETTGIPQRLDHALYEGLNRELETAHKKDMQFLEETNAITKQLAKDIRNLKYEELKQMHIDYTKLYDNAVKHNRKRLSIFRLFVWIFGLLALGSVALGIGSCFFDSADTVPELMKPFYESSGILGMILFVIFGVIWWILYAIYTNMGEPENSGMAYRYSNMIGVIENKVQTKKFYEKSKSDTYFAFLYDWENDDKDEEELYEDEMGNYYADDDPENPKNKKKDNTIIDEKYGFTASDENLDKAIKIKEYCERNNKIFSAVLIKDVLGVELYIAKNLKESAEDDEEDY